MTVEEQMEVVEAIKTRKSIRGFLPRPVPKQVLENILGLAARSPSWANSQPWEVTVIGGEIMEQVKEALFQETRSGATPDPDIPDPQFSELYRTRTRDLGYRLYAALGIKREDKKAREEWALQGVKFFDAPNGLILYLDRELGPWFLLDLGLFLQSITLVALTFGLGTCPLAAVVRYPKVLRKILGIPDEKMIVCGIAIGYPDWQHPANNLQSPREPVEVFTQWHGL